MNIRIVVDRFSSKKNLDTEKTFNRMPTANEIYQFLGGSGTFEECEKIAQRVMG